MASTQRIHGLKLLWHRTPDNLASTCSERKVPWCYLIYISPLFQPSWARNCMAESFEFFDIKKGILLDRSGSEGHSFWARNQALFFFFFFFLNFFYAMVLRDTTGRHSKWRAQLVLAVISGWCAVRVGINIGLFSLKMAYDTACLCISRSMSITRH